jgi:hypothetical protein
MEPNLPTDETFSEGSDMPPMADVPRGTKPSPAPLSVPLSFLSQPDDMEQMQTPAKGDTGTMQVDFMVTDIQGDMATIQPVAVNGNDLEEEKAEELPDADIQEGEDLKAMATAMDSSEL